MGGALQAIARSSPARGARMEGRERVGDGRQGRAEGKVREEGWGLSYYTLLTWRARRPSNTGRKEKNRLEKKRSVGKSGNRSHSFPGGLTGRQVRAHTGVMLIDPSASWMTLTTDYKTDRFLCKQQSKRWNYSDEGQCCRTFTVIWGF